MGQFDVSAFAKGFLGLLGAKNLGKGIALSSDVIQPTVEMTPMLGANYRLQQFAFVDPIVNGFNACLSVPASEVWRVKAGHMSVFVTAGFLLTNCMIMVVPPESPPNTAASRYFAASNPVSFAVSASNAQTLVPWLWPDLILNPGSLIQIFCTAATGAATQTIGHISLYTEVFRS